jgi:hypothetical protein
MEVAFILGGVVGVIIIAAALFASFDEYDNNQWKNKRY